MPDEHREATEAAAKHRSQAGELYAQHRSEGRDELLDQARQEDGKAAYFEEKAQGGGQKKDTFQRDGEASGYTERRAWYAPGSVADDKMLSFEEAKQGGILDEVTKGSIPCSFLNQVSLKFFEACFRLLETYFLNKRSKVPL